MTTKTALYISEMDPLTPDGSELYSTVDEYIRQLAIIFQTQFPGFTTSTPVTSTISDLNLLVGLTGETLELLSNKNVANGYAPLDGSVLLPLVNLPTNLTGKIAADSLALGTYSAALYPRLAQNVTVTGLWSFDNDLRLDSGRTLLIEDPAFPATYRTILTVNGSDEVEAGTFNLNWLTEIQDYFRISGGDLILDNLAAVKFRNNPYTTELSALTISAGNIISVGNNLASHTYIYGGGNVNFLQTGSIQLAGTTLHSACPTNVFDNSVTISGTSLHSGNATFNGATNIFSGTTFTDNATTTNINVNFANIKPATKLEITKFVSVLDGLEVQVSNNVAKNDWIRFQEGATIRGAITSPVGTNDVIFERDGNFEVMRIQNGANEVEFAATPTVGGIAIGQRPSRVMNYRSTIFDTFWAEYTIKDADDADGYYGTTVWNGVEFEFTASERVRVEGILFCNSQGTSTIDHSNWFNILPYDTTGANFDHYVSFVLESGESFKIAANFPSGSPYPSDRMYFHVTGMNA